MAAVDSVLNTIHREVLDTLDKNLVQDPTVSLLVCQLAPKLFDFIRENHAQTFNVHRSIPADSIFKIIRDPVEVFFANLLAARNRNDTALIKRIIQQLRDAVGKLASYEERAQKISTLQMITELLAIPKKELTLSPPTLLFQYYVAKKLNNNIWISEFLKAIKDLGIVAIHQLDEIIRDTYRLDDAKIRYIKDDLSKPLVVKLPDGQYELENGDVVSEEKYREIVEEAKVDECMQELQTLSISPASAEVVDLTAMKYIKDTLALDIPISTVVYQCLPGIFDHLSKRNFRAAVHPLFSHLPCLPETFIAQVLRARMENDEQRKKDLLQLLQNSFQLVSLDSKISYESMRHEILNAFNAQPKSAESIPVYLFQFHIASLVGDMEVANVLAEYILLRFNDPNIEQLALLQTMEVLKLNRKYTREEIHALLEDFKGQVHIDGQQTVDQNALYIIQRVHALKKRETNPVEWDYLVKQVTTPDEAIANAILNLDANVISTLLQ